ncbi:MULTISPECIES: AAA family ATPase [unclassified Hyphomonas]|jgi:pilus assembly protein CpaE|uniref:Type II/IV secretion system ATPase TadZ/CpaE,associated with Flp pilus assembly n=2 Tax=root TaxID=1 RepID=A0A160TWX1_9ZZZZ|nr:MULTISPECIES: AAA family ATPase [unclassified Hyphomonas]MAA82079.1 pilus assembly protein CpaE [Hyphomonas sp.]MBO6582980.1 AAA family ATPase [Hyphomonas sp.]MDF1806950.1 AAA family ATPase [Hyphomonas sp.]QSR21223.1 pilus assembly protein CpaE [Hyphomonas sp. KY3]RCL87772.1 MAG: pilus assembly protein CpaE [Hyphomonas sp.]|tara:strand:- start:8727 stop:10115 length:1389 start_codon:yes stop_codon:yes gene_type:complete
MSNENALFDDDFEDVFSEDSMSDHTPSDIDLNEVDDSVDQAVAEGAPMGLTADNDTHGLGHSEPSGGDVMLPAISIKLFYERAETRGLLEVSAQDRRMGRATVECIPGGIPAAIAYMSENPTPNLLMIESSESAGQVVREIDALAEHCDETVKVMVIGAVNDIMLYRQLIARGVSEYLVPPFQPLQIIRSIGELFVNPDSPFVGKQISVVGAKGGVGASTIAHNLSWALAENVKVNTTLVDLDLSFGTTALDFNQETPQTVADALLAPERADESVIERLLAKPTDRLSLFTAPATINQIMDIPDEAYTTVIEGVRRNVPYLVLDLPHIWSSWMLSTLIASDEVIVVCQPDLASLRNGKNMIDQLKAKRPNDHPPRLVLNMSGVPKRPEIPVKDFAAAIGVEPDVILPFDPELFGTAANNGQMISETDPASKSAQAIDHLASTLTGRAVEPQEKSFLKKLLGK